MLKRMLVLALVFAGGVGLLARADRPEPVPVRQTFDQFPMQLGDWRGVQDPPFTPEILAILGVDDYMARAYFTPERAGVGVYVGYYGSQRQGDTMHSPLNCLPGAGWSPVSFARIGIPVRADEAAGAETVTINRYVIEKGLDRQVVLYWYQSQGRVVASEYWGKIYLVLDAIRNNRTDGALVRITVPIRTTDEEATQRAVAFAQAVYPLLGRYLPS